MDSLQAARELRHALQTFITSNTDIMGDESKMMEFSTLYPTWEELLATKKTYPAKTVFRWGVNAAGEPQLWSFISDYTPQEIYTPEEDISHYKKVGVTEDGVPIWTQPLGATDAYKLGDEVSHKGNIWVSDYDNNVWEPGVFGWHVKQDTPSDEDGTQEHPFTAARGMEYEYGKYYLDPEDSKTYLCKRTGEAEGGKVTLQYLPHELIGQYFEEAVE